MQMACGVTPQKRLRTIPNRLRHRREWAMRDQPPPVVTWWSNGRGAARRIVRQSPAQHHDQWKRSRASREAGSRGGLGTVTDLGLAVRANELFIDQSVPWRRTEGK